MRYLIYFIYNAAGRVDAYIPPLLAELRARYDVIHVVFNGTLAPGEAARLEPVADRILQRENVEFDVGAYKAALFSNPDEYYAGLSELTLANFTFFAPIGDLSDYFAWADDRDMDFWGISAHKAMTPNPFTGEGDLPYHIQSHWISVGRRILQSRDFLAYWRDLPAIKSYMDSVLYHESQFTRHFSGLGYEYEVYLNDSDYVSDYPAFNEVERAIREGFPLLKRRLFYHIPAYLDRYEINLRGALEHIERRGLYDCDLIWGSVAPSVDPGILYQNADLLFIVPDETALPAPAPAPARLILLASGEFGARRASAVIQRIAFDCRAVLLTPSAATVEAFAAAAADNPRVVAFEPLLCSDIRDCFQRLGDVLADEDSATPVLFATVSERDREQFQYGLDHLARDRAVAGGAQARLRQSDWFGLILPPTRTYGKTPETSALTEEARFELQSDLDALGLNQSLGDHVLYSTAGVMWVRAGLLADIAQHLATPADSRPIFEEFADGDDRAAPAYFTTDGREFDSFLTVGLPYFARDHGYATLVLSNTAALPRNFVKLEARYRRFAERLGMGDPFEMASHADYLMRFSSQDDRETIFSEVHHQAYEKGWKNAVETIWNQAINQGRKELARELSHLAGNKDRESGAAEMSDADWAVAAEAVREQVLKEGFEKGFQDGWSKAAEDVYPKAFNEGWAAAGLRRRGLVGRLRRLLGRRGG